MLFKEVIGLHSTKGRLIHQVKSGRISHAQLFLGKEGIGNLPLALAFAQYVNCEQPFDDDSCGRCVSCKQIEKLEHPDVHFSFPTIHSVAKKSDNVLSNWREAVLNNPYLNINDWYTSSGDEKKQGIIGKEESSEIHKKLSLKSHHSKYKILILWYPENLHHVAANKLLKIIEEPPQNTLIILVAQQTENILGTILSRTQLIKLEPISENEIAEFLIEKKSVDKGTAQSIASISEGNIRYAIKKSTEPDSQDFAMFSHWMRICFKKDVGAIINWVEEFASYGREKHKQFIQYALHMFRQAIIRNYTGGEMVKLMGEEDAFNIKFAPFINELNIQDLTEDFNLAYQHVERNANPKVLFLDLSFRVFKNFKKVA